jgi:hypothetical protein
VPIVLKSGSLNLLEPSGPVKACNGIAFFKTCIRAKKNLILGHILGYVASLQLTAQPGKLR